MRRIIALAMSLGLACAVSAATQGRAEAATCNVNASVFRIKEYCAAPSEGNGSEAGDIRAGSTTSTGQRRRPFCSVRTAGRCVAGLACTTATRRPGTYYVLFTDGAKFPTRTCLPTPGTPTDDAARPALTDALVAQAMRRLTWPTPRLTVQPPGGRTLVNLPTNLYTPDHTPRRQNTTLLTQTVTIETTPIRYTWNLGADAPLTTTDPGAPYPDLRVTHRYTRKGTHQLPLAVTYTGRWRTTTDPAGQWRPIPGTLTLTTPTQPLQVVEATPQLRGY